MKKINHHTINNKEDIKMAKYIVEAPKPQKGQKISSGGIRENGKLASQFKNPIPYNEPTHTPTNIVQKSNTEQLLKEQARARRNKTEMYLISLVWEEFGEPLLRSGLHKLCNKIIDKIETPSNHPIQHLPSPDPEIIDVEANEIETIYDNDKIICFPDRKAN